VEGGRSPTLKRGVGRQHLHVLMPASVDLGEERKGEEYMQSSVVTKHLSSGKKGSGGRGAGAQKGNSYNEEEGDGRRKSSLHPRGTHPEREKRHGKKVSRPGGEESELSERLLGRGAGDDETGAPRSVLKGV